MQLDYDHLRALGAIVRSGSFDAAAAELGVTASAISQRLKALEERVGTRLVVRGAPCTATDLGRKLARHMEDVAVMEAQLLPQAGTAPQITLAVNSDSLDTWLIPALAAAAHLRFDLKVDDQDHSAELLKSGEVAAAITARAQPVQGCDAMALGALGYVATASPEFAAQWFAKGITPAALQAAPTLIYNRKDGLQAAWAAREVGAPVRLSGHHIPSTTSFVEAAIHGMGWGMNPEILVREGLATGRLVALGRMPEYHTPLYWQIARRMKDPLAALTRSIRAAARVHLVAPPPQSR